MRPTGFEIILNLVPWFLIGSVWIVGAVLTIWVVLSLRRMSRALEAIHASVTRIEGQHENR